MIQKKTKKDKLKKTWSELRYNVELSTAQGKIQGAEWALRHYDKYRKISYFILWGFFMYFLVTGSWLYSFIAYGLLHLHVLFNQNLWALRNLNHKYEKLLENGMQLQTKDD